MRPTHLTPIVALVVQLLCSTCRAEEVEAQRIRESDPEAGAAIRPGRRIRVSTRSGPADPARIVGVLLDVAADTLVVRADTNGTQVRLPIASVTRLEVSRGHKKGFVLGASIGFLSGAALAMALQKAFCGFSEDDDCGIEVAQTVGGGMVGAIPGAFIGRLLSSESWEEVALGGPRLGVVLGPRGRILLAASYAF